jgi:hypothetical protein
MKKQGALRNALAMLWPRKYRLGRILSPFSFSFTLYIILVIYLGENLKAMPFPVFMRNLPLSLEHERNSVCLVNFCLVNVFSEPKRIQWDSFPKRVNSYCMRLL